MSSTSQPSTSTANGANSGTEPSTTTGVSTVAALVATNTPTTTMHPSSMNLQGAMQAVTNAFNSPSTSNAASMQASDDDLATTADAKEDKKPAADSSSEDDFEKESADDDAKAGPKIMVSLTLLLFHHCLEF